MGFADRVVQANTVIAVLDAHIWQAPPCKGRLTVVPYGYETHVSDAVRQQMRYLRTTTSRHIRFTPDFFVLDRQYPDRIYLFEYKVTQTPLWSRNRITSIGQANSITDLTWQNLAQMEADAY